MEGEYSFQVFFFFLHIAKPIDKFANSLFKGFKGALKGCGDVNRKQSTA